MFSKWTYLLFIEKDPMDKETHQKKLAETY